MKCQSWNGNSAYFRELTSCSWSNQNFLRWKIAHPWLDSNPRPPDNMCSNQIREWDIFQLRICDTGSGDDLLVCKHTNADHAQPTAPIFDCWRVVFERIEIVSFWSARKKSYLRRLGYTVNALSMELGHLFPIRAVRVYHTIYILYSKGRPYAKRSIILLSKQSSFMSSINRKQNVFGVCRES